MYVYLSQDVSLIGIILIGTIYFTLLREYGPPSCGAYVLMANYMQYAFFEIIVVLTVVVPWTSYQIHRIAGCACAGNTGNVFPATTG